MGAMTSPRLPPATLPELGIVNWAICRVISQKTRTREAHLFTAVGRQRRLFRAWLRFAASMMPGGTINRHESEMVILRVAHLRHCQYELDHHVRLGARVGIDGELLRKIFEGPSAPDLDDRRRALLTAVDELVRNKDLSDATWEGLRSHYTVPQMVELCMLVGHYEMLATTIAALRVPRDFPAEAA
jgi:AhpD family alkylhydroperoxidase